MEEEQQDQPRLPETILENLGSPVFDVREISRSPSSVVFSLRRHDSSAPREVLKVLTVHEASALELPEGTIHPGILPVSASGQGKTSAGRFFWCLMPWLENPLTLRQALVSRLEATDSTRSTAGILVWLAERLDEAAAALTALHARGLAHLDIKPDNMLVADEGRLVIADTASCRFLRGKDQCGVTLTRYYAHPDLRALLSEAATLDRQALILPRNKLSFVHDLYSLGRSILELLSLLDTRHPGSLPYDPVFSWLHLAACRMLDGHNLPSSDPEVLSEIWPGLGREELALLRYRSMEAVSSDFAKLVGRHSPGESIPELAGTGGRRIMVSPGQPAPLTDRVRAIIEHPVFSRLASVPQIELLSSIFPTATHTRYEHSLGAFRNAVRYLASLLHDVQTPLFRQLADTRHLTVLLLGTLVHDLGQYPFGHTIEELGEHFRHETLSRDFLDNPTRDSSGRTIREIIEDPEHGWGIPLADLKRFLSTPSGREDLFDERRPVDEMLHSILDGPIDVDKLDYLVRDSRMCFLNYGDAIDSERLIANLTIVIQHEQDANGRETRRLCLGAYERGEPAAEALSFVRYLLYQTLYWHHASRAGRAMFKAALAPLVTAAGKRPARGSHYHPFMADIARLLGVTEEPQPITLSDVLNHFEKKADEPGRALIALIRARRYYKRICTIHEGSGSRIQIEDFRNATRKPGFDETLRKILRARFESRLTTRQGPGASLLTPDRSGPALEILSRQRTILCDAPRPSIGSHNQLLFVPEPQRLERNHSERHRSGERVSAVWNDVHARLMSIAAKGRVFCHPDLREALLAALGPAGVEDCILEAMKK